MATCVLSLGPLVEGTLVKRYKRFLADIELENGELVTEIGRAHV